MKKIYILLLSSFISLLILVICSLRFGHHVFSFHDLLDTYRNMSSQQSNYHIIYKLRLSRTVLALLVGACLGVSGLLIQNLTSNSMASPCIFGINAGAGLFIVFGLLLFHNLSLFHIIVLSFLGSAVTASIIFTVGFYDEFSPIRIVLTGIILTAFVSALGTVIIISKGGNPQEVLKWTAGSFVDRPMVNSTLITCILVCFLLVSIYASQLNIFILGINMATSLGQDTFFWKIVFFVFIVIFAGFSVAVAGMIGFLGLIIPHITKRVVGFDYQISVPFSMLFGANFMLAADLLSRSVILKVDLPVSFTMSCIGAPFLIYLVNRKGTA